MDNKKKYIIDKIKQLRKQGQLGGNSIVQNITGLDYKDVLYTIVLVSGVVRHTWALKYEYEDADETDKEKYKVIESLRKKINDKFGNIHETFFKIPKLTKDQVESIQNSANKVMNSFIKKVDWEGLVKDEQTEKYKLTEKAFDFEKDTVQKDISLESSLQEIFEGLAIILAGNELLEISDIIKEEGKKAFKVTLGDHDDHHIYISPKTSFWNEGVSPKVLNVIDIEQVANTFIELLQVMHKIVEDAEEAEKRLEEKAKEAAAKEAEAEEEKKEPVEEAEAKKAKNEAAAAAGVVPLNTAAAAGGSNSRCKQHKHVKIVNKMINKLITNLNDTTKIVLKKKKT